MTEEELAALRGMIAETRGRGCSRPAWWARMRRDELAAFAGRLAWLAEKLADERHPVRGEVVPVYFEGKPAEPGRGICSITLYPGVGLISGRDESTIELE